MVQTIGIFKVRASEANAPGFVVHQLGEAFHRAAAIDRQGHSRVVAGLEHQPIQKLLHRQNLTGLQVHGRPLDAHSLRHNLHPVQHIALLANHQRRHNLGGAGNEAPAIGIFLIEDPAGACVH